MKDPLTSIHIAKPPRANATCQVRWNVYQENRTAIVTRACGEPAVMTIYVNHFLAPSWSYSYCDLHGQRRLEELRQQIIKPAEEKVEDKRTA